MNLESHTYRIAQDDFARFADRCGWVLVWCQSFFRVCIPPRMRGGYARISEIEQHGFETPSGLWLGAGISSSTWSKPPAPHGWFYVSQYQVGSYSPHTCLFKTRMKVKRNNPRVEPWCECCGAKL